MRSRVGRDRAFYKKSTKARSKSAFSQAARPCLLQKIGKGTVRKCVLVSGVTVPFANNRQRHGQKEFFVSGVTVPFVENSEKSKCPRRRLKCAVPRPVNGTEEGAAPKVYLLGLPLPLLRRHLFLLTAQFSPVLPGKYSNTFLLPSVFHQRCFRQFAHPSEKGCCPSFDQSHLRCEKK